MSTNETVNEETKSVQYPYSVVVRFRGEGKPYSFGAFDSDYHKEDWVVVETQQGFEIGQVQADALSVEKYGLHMPTKPVVRKATEYDHRAYEENLELETEAYDICNTEIKDLALDMNLLSAQYTLDRSKILFVYLAEQRVDFRELLKRLGSKLHCRIELRQIGERDKAKMVGGIGMCGMECCCSRFKSHFDIISINMAKNQLLALNIDKLSGMCGKLKCCLKYEDDDYKQLIEGLPKVGSQVEYEGEIYRLTNMNVMSKEAKLENRETAMFITLEELKEKGIPRKGVIVKKKPEEEGKKVKKTIIHQNRPEAAPKHVNYDLQTPEVKKEVRTFGKKKENNNHNEHRNNSYRNNHRRQETNTENKNITVRTFGRKKNTGEDK
jgi:cell fate regulator YaaT (PSP1 superfamily)